MLVVLVGAGLGLGLAPSGNDETATSTGSASADAEPVQPDTDPGAGATEPGPDSGSGDSGSGDSGAPDPDDPGDFEPAVAQAHRDLFTTIDESERTMIELQEAMPPGTAELGDDEVTAFRDRAGEVAGQLEDLHDELEDIDDAGSADVTAIREQYLLHLQDWVDWSSALADDPTLLDRPDAAAPYSQAINDSAAFFADAVADNLDRDRAPGDAVALADEIIERGFDSGDDGGTEI